MALRQGWFTTSPHNHPPSPSSTSSPPYERYHAQTRHHNVRTLGDLPAVDQNNRHIRYCINDPNDRPPIDARNGPIHHNINEPEGLPSIDDEYPSIEFDDPPHQQYCHDARRDSISQRGRHEPSGFNHAPSRRQSLPYFDPIELLGDHRHTREASFAPIDFEDRTYTDNTTDTGGRHEAFDVGHARYMRHLRQQSPYFDPIEVDKEHPQAREAHFAEIDTAAPHMGQFEFDPSRVEFELIDIDEGYALTTS